MVLVVSLCCLCQAAAEPAQVIIIRHAEKPDEGDDLSLAGRERAAALVPYFLGNLDVLEYKAPVAIYAQGPKTDGSSRRPVQTVKPLANALNLPVIDKYTREEFPLMVEEVRSRPEYEGKMVLICWEHKVIPGIAKAFGAMDAPDKFRGDSFDRTWVITFKPGGKVVYKDLPQKLMYGDSPD